MSFRCESCLHFEPYRFDISVIRPDPCPPDWMPPLLMGRCHRYPPQVLSVDWGSVSVGWAEVKPHDWCAEHEDVRAS